MVEKALFGFKKREFMITIVIIIVIINLYQWRYCND